MKIFPPLVAGALLLTGCTSPAVSAPLAAVAKPAPDGARTPPKGIDRTGAGDVTDELLAFIANVPDGSTVAFPAGARYRIEGTLDIVNRSGLTFEANGAEFFATTDGSATVPYDGKTSSWPRHRAHWRFDGGSDLTLRNAVISGPNAAVVYDASLEAQSGVQVAGSTDVLIEGVQVFDVHGDGVTVGEAAKRVTVRNSSIAGAGRQGISISEGEDVTVTANRIANVARSGIDLEPLSDWAVRRVTVTDNDFTAPIGNAIFANLGSGLAVEDIAWVDNRAHGVPFTVKSGAGNRRSRYVFSGNTSDTVATGGPAVRFANIDGLVAHDNTIPVAPYREGKHGTVQDSGAWLALDDVTGADLANNGPALITGTYSTV